MSREHYLQGATWVERERMGWSPSLKLILAFILGVLLLSPAVLGLYWEVFLP